MENLYLSGPGAEMLGFPELLEGEVNCPVHVLDEVTHVDRDKGAPDLTLALYIMPLGAMISPLDVMPEEMKKGEKKGSESLFAPVLIFLLCGAMAVILVGIAFLQKQLAQTDLKQQQTIQGQKQYIREVYQEYLDLSDLYSQLESFYASTDTPNENLIQILEEMEDQLPTGTKITSLTSSDTTLTMSVEAPSPAKGADVLVHLEKMTWFSSVSTTSMSLGDGTPDSTVTFTVICTYVESTEASTEAVQAEETTQSQE